MEKEDCQWKNNYLAEPGKKIEGPIAFPVPILYFGPKSTTLVRTPVSKLKNLLLWACITLATTGNTQSTGRLLINEYLTWPSNACPTTTEFVELMNFGPGPMDISCHVLTNGIYSITIPPNTILQPGQFFTLGGQDVIPAPCANTDSTITVDLNWTTCGCTNMPITGPEGFLADGSVANEKLVLMDPSGMVVDAVARDIPLIPSNPITTSSTGGCPTRTFDLDTMNIRYEILGMSAGRANSFARVNDGDCQWVKDPEQTGNGSNNKGLNTDITYSFVLTNAMDCDSVRHGTISIFVKHNDYSKVFPMSYTLVLDSNKNGDFDFDDYYSFGSDSTPPEIKIDSLVVGHYRVTIGSADGCYLKTFDFTILPCFPVMPVKLIYFRHDGVVHNQHRLEWMLTDVEYLESVTVEKAVRNGGFITDRLIPASGLSGSRRFSATVNGDGKYRYFRLLVKNRDGSQYYSPVISSDLARTFAVQKFWPNPAKAELFMELASSEAHKAMYTIYDVSGHIARQGILTLHSGTNMASVPVYMLSSGIYQVQIKDPASAGPPVSFRFVKH